jgi:hypothetical protein
MTALLASVEVWNNGTCVYRGLRWDGRSNVMFFDSGFGYVEVSECTRCGWEIRTVETVARA